MQTNDFRYSATGLVALLLFFSSGCFWEKDKPKTPQDTKQEFPKDAEQKSSGLKKSSVGFGPPAPGWEKKVSKNDDNDDNEDTQAKLDFTGLRGVLAGKWEKKDNKNEHLQFTEKSVELKQWFNTDVGKFETKGDLLTVTDTRGGVNVYGLEFLSDGEIALRPEKVKDGTDFSDLAGQWRRVSLPPGGNPAVLGTGPVADAKRLVRKIEATLAKHEGIQKAALAERDELAVKLRSVGVNSAAELKGNVRGQRVAENLTKLAAEIEGREQQLADIDTALLRAKSLVRKMESEEANLSDAEMRKLAVQLKEVEERTDRTPLPVTPLDVEAAVEQALKATPKKSK